ncbi:DUF5668 domain-containing protein [Massilia sp. IC2-477]|uniref:LiaI-LiaF-like domain-containing protein n=1 Tax=unclassified Massilia TaxID=2609279 RepID=UPI001D0FF84E|nr:MULTISPECIES: DUF5668 domain-containing protein [unclassified Massilia]MCC2955208.1 DUF5668 domain-containing protein [Massilia sp. IC2-477]MCC2972449.1 DUF5668 domain-containing protein [Massilia sp. IC2-476]
MHTEDAYSGRKQAVWGILMIAFGTFFLLDRMDFLDAETYWHYWPLALVIVGLTQLAGFPKPRDIGNGLWSIFIGLWLYACLGHVYGLTFRNSWPLFILAWGVKLVCQPFIERRLAANTPESKQ